MRAQAVNGVRVSVAFLVALAFAAGCGATPPGQGQAAGVKAPLAVASPSPAADLMLLVPPAPDRPTTSDDDRSGPLAGEDWNPTPRPTFAPPGWIDVAVRSRGVFCALTVTGDAQIASREVRTEHASCTLSMTDARVSGALTADVTVTFTPQASSAGTWVGDFRLVNGLGSWIGTGHGAAVRGSDEPSDIDLYGQAVYRGSGAYAGLSCTLLLSGEGAPAMLTGWISGPAPTDPWTRVVVFQ